MQVKASHGKSFGFGSLNMKHEVIVAPGVESELTEILEYIVAKFGKSAANQFMGTFSSKIDSIANFPEQFPKTDKFPDARKCILNNRYAIYYRIHPEGQVEILSLRDARSSRA